MSAGRKAIGWAVAGILVAAAAGVGYSVLRPKNDPRVIGALPKGLRLMPRSQFNTKPWFSLPWFGGKRLTYPTNTTMPKGFKDEPDLAGILTWGSSHAGCGIDDFADGEQLDLQPNADLLRPRFLEG